MLKENYTAPTLAPADPNELLYRFFKADTRLIKAILENNNFSHTDGHNWNLLWL
jgi:hypothetical protein